MTYEDFTTYTEVDEDGTDITVIASKVSWTLDLDDTSYVYKDFSAAFFGDFDHDFEVNIVSANADGKTAAWAMANVISEYDALFDASTTSLFVLTQAPSGNYRLYVRDMASSNTDYVDVSQNTLYYCTIERSSTTLTLYVYSDSDRTVLVDSAAITCTNTTFRYLYACMSTDENQSPYPITAFTQNLDLHGAVFESLSDSVSISDSVVYKHEIPIADNINISDSLSVIDKYVIVLSDSINIIDVIALKRKLNLADNVSVSDIVAFKHFIGLTDSVSISDSMLHKRLLNLFDNITINDAIILKHMIYLADSVNVNDFIGIKYAYFLFDNISILDDIDITSFNECSAIFQLQSTSHTIFLPMPIYGGESGSINNELVLFDFWTNTRSLDTIGINSEPIILSGTIFACTDNEETEITAIATKFLNIHDIMDNHEEISITGLNNCVDAVYVIKDFKYETIEKSPYAYTWQLTLEYVRAIT